MSQAPELPQAVPGQPPGGAPEGQASGREAGQHAQDQAADGPQRASGERVVAIVLNWNGGDETREALASLRASEGLELVPLLADNGSQDGVLEAELAHDPGLETLRLGSNLGYAGGNNRAMQRAFNELGADWVCLINSDLALPPATLSRLVQAAREWQAAGDAPVGAVGPCLLYKDRPDVVWACGGAIGSRLNVTRLLGHGRAYVAARGRTESVDYVPGTCLLVSRAAWAATGGMDEAFFCYLEDADWCLRMRQEGYSVLAVGTAVAFHGLSASTGGGYSAGRKYMTAVNSVRFLRKHGSVSGWAALLVFDLMLWPLALLRALFLGRASAAAAKLRGVLAGLAGAQVDADVAARYARRRS
ncbi:MAG: hypothetical protein DRQ55_07430 [Planctomycetota bacterium]|nr:MAG: hypothetical protein DRQ55_07430 [Planctomycetota bacterium]